MVEIRDAKTQNKISKNATTDNYNSVISKLNGLNTNFDDLIRLFANTWPNMANDHVNSRTQFVCIDGPSGSGKNTLLDHFEGCNDGHPLSILDTNIFMKPRFERNDDEIDSLFRNWYRTDLFKEKLVSFLNPADITIIDQAYRHDKDGDISHIVKILPGPFRILMGRYSLHPEIQSVFKRQSIDTTKIIIDAPQSLRLKRVKQRAYVQMHRTPEEQEKLIIDTVDIDWFRYFPSIFFTSDWYIVNYSDSYSTYRKPQDCINRNHVWGAYADLHVKTDRLYRLIEIGKNGATSLHMHKNLDEIYLHVLGGPLGVTIRTDFDEKEVRLVPGKSLTIPHGVYHKAYALDNTPPVYYETVLPVKGSTIDSNDIYKLSNAIPKSGSLTYLE